MASILAGSGLVLLVMSSVARVGRVIGWGLAGTWLLVSLAAHAQEPSAGAKAYEAGQYTVALAAFQEAYRLSPRPGLLFSIAQTLRRSYEEAGSDEQRQSAIEHYERYLAEAPNGDRSAEAKSWLDGLRGDSSGGDGALSTLSPETSLSPQEPRPDAKQATTAGAALKVRPPGALSITGNDGAVVYVDGRRVGSLPMPALRLAQGRHTIDVLEAGRSGVAYVAELEPGVTHRVHLAGPPTTRHVASLAVVGVGSAILAAGGVFGYLALQREADARTLQDTPGAGADFDEAILARDRLRAAAALSVGVGVSSVLGGIVSLATERPSADRTSGSRAQRPALHVAFPLGLTVSGTF